MRSIVLILLVFIAAKSFGQARFIPIDNNDTTLSYSKNQGALKHAADSTANSQRTSFITSNRSAVYKSLQGLQYGSTFSNPQQSVAIWGILWQLGFINPATMQVDSTLNYIK